MLRLEEGAAALTLTSRLAAPRVLAVLAAALLGAAVALRAVAPLAWAFAGAALLLVLLGGRAVRARVDAGRVTVRPAVPLARVVTAPLGRFAGVAVETMAEERRRRGDAVARRYAERAGAELPRWFERTPAPGANDHLQRLVLVPVAAGEPLAVTAWLAPDDDLEPARRALQARLGAG
jgi:hypothetical protein